MDNQLQIATGKRPTMSKSQNGLLKLMFDCIRNDEALTFEQLVYCYANNVKDEVYCSVIEFSRHGAKWIYKSEYFNIIEQFIANSWVFNHRIKPLIRSWFVSAIGLLVIKGYLKVLPNIDID